MCSAGAVAAVLSSASLAAARSADVHLVWRRPVGSLCPTRDALEADVEQLIGRRVFTASTEARVTLRGEIDETSQGVSVHIEAIDARGRVLGTRHLAAPSGQCETLRGAIALVLTLFVEHEHGLVAEPDLVLGLGAEATLARAPMPRFALAAGPTLLVAWGSTLELHASAQYWLPVAIQTARGVGASLEAFSLELRGCGRFAAGLGLCAGAASGALIATPLRLRGPERQVRLLAHGLAEASWSLELGRAARAELAAGALFSFSRPAFSYLAADGEQRAVYRPQLAGLIFRLTVIILRE